MGNNSSKSTEIPCTFENLKDSDRKEEFDNFYLLGKLGEGSQAVVYLARRKTEDVKVTRLASHEMESCYGFFFQEFSLTLRLP